MCKLSFVYLALQYTGTRIYAVDSSYIHLYASGLPLEACKTLGDKIVYFVTADRMRIMRPSAIIR